MNLSLDSSTAIKDMLNQVQNVFQNVISSCFTSFSNIHSPIISIKEVDDLICACKTNLPRHYRLMMRLLDFDSKIVLASCPDSHSMYTNSRFDA